MLETKADLYHSLRDSISPQACGANWDIWDNESLVNLASRNIPEIQQLYHAEPMHFHPDIRRILKRRMAEVKRDSQVYEDMINN